MSFDSLAFRQVLGRFATGVTVVTTRDSVGANCGVTVNSFASVSLDPPLVLFCLDKAAMSFEAFSRTGQFAVNFLSADQHDLSIRFATAATDKWDGIAYDLWPSEIPVLKDCLANLGCRKEAVHEGGDHVIIVGRVEILSLDDDKGPLVYYQSGYRELGRSI
ncbi:flavin reductase family protein [Pelagibius litoralis]|uniref:Flavin reductase family protein n=1 Tax=Pelagibius litoralis TaxID=374515 RepID=A0A967C1T6_9PROT|nr:flavin reductase family protein [Pelagibius litoralis]NIA67013.1 flavin reductase family protein [Pelagibius litoralis]